MMLVHSMKFLHNSIQESNILLEYREDRWHGVIIDFSLLSTIAFPYIGFTKDPLEQAQDHDIEDDECSHIAPEVLEGGHSSVQSDVFAVGNLAEIIGKFIADDELMAVGSCCVRGEADLRQGLEVTLKKIITITERLRQERDGDEDGNEEEEFEGG